MLHSVVSFLKADTLLHPYPQPSRYPHKWLSPQWQFRVTASEPSFFKVPASNGYCLQQHPKEREKSLFSHKVSIHYKLSHVKKETSYGEEKFSSTMMEAKRKKKGYQVKNKDKKPSAFNIDTLILIHIFIWLLCIFSNIFLKYSI